MTKILIQKQSDAFYPMDDAALESTKAITENSFFVVDIKQSRNPLFHRRAFACFRELFDMIDTELAFEPWRKMLTILAGYRTDFASVDKNGKTTVYVQAESLTFENMDEDEFKTCFNAIVNSFGHRYGRDLTLEELEAWSRI